MSSIDNTRKWSISVYSGLLFFIIASPFLFKLVNQITTKLGVGIANDNGCPNMAGLLLHTVVFVLIVRLSMEN